MAGSLLIQRQANDGSPSDNGVLSGRHPCRLSGTLFCFWSGVAHEPASSDPKLKVGYIPIIDCAPVILAENLGAYERQGLEVEIRREVSWANVRDKLALGVLDASHILAPLPLAITLGIDSVTVPLVNVMTLEVNGNALTLSNALWQEIEEAAPELVGAATRRSMRMRTRSRRSPRAPPPAGRSSCWRRCFPIRCRTTWCGSGCRRAARSRSRRAPHRRAAAAHRGAPVGRRDRRLLRRRAVEPAVARRSASAASRSPAPTSGKACRRRCWAPPRPCGERIPNTVKALVKALIEACLWLDDPANRAEAARVLSSPRYLNTPAEVIARTLELPDFHVFHRDARQLPVAQPRRLVPRADGALGSGRRPASTSHGHRRSRLPHRPLSRRRARDGRGLSRDVDRLPPGGDMASRPLPRPPALDAAQTFPPVYVQENRA